MNLTWDGFVSLYNKVKKVLVIIRTPASLYNEIPVYYKSTVFK